MVESTQPMSVHLLTCDHPGGFYTHAGVAEYPWDDYHGPRCGYVSPKECIRVACAVDKFYLPGFEGTFLFRRGYDFT